MEYTVLIQPMKANETIREHYGSTKTWIVTFYTTLKKNCFVNSRFQGLVKPLVLNKRCWRWNS